MLVKREDGKGVKMNSKLFSAGLILCLGIGILGAKELKVLMVGNSFSDSVGIYLPKIVKASGNKLELTGAFIGSCSLEQHSNNLIKAEKDPSCRPYRITVWNSDAPGKRDVRKGNVNELLEKNRYDVITLQQGGSRAPDRKTFHPHLERILEYIRKKQPQAEIVFQQTWSYRIDDTRFKPHPNPKFDFDQTGMYERVRDVYRALAAEHKMRVIPVGTAVQCFRKNTPIKFEPPKETPVYPAIPPWKGDAVGYISWKKNKKTGKTELNSDFIHLNSFGKYIQACVWYSFLFGEPVSKIAWKPKDFSKDECALLRKSAAEAMEQYQQAK